MGKPLGEVQTSQHCCPWERTALTPVTPALALKLVNLVPPHMSLFSSCYPSLELRGREFVGKPVYRLRSVIPRSPAASVSISHNPPGFHSRYYGDSTSWHWCPGLGPLVPQWVPLKPKYPPFPNPYTEGEGRACPISQAILPLSMWLLLYILSYGTSA